MEKKQLNFNAPLLSVRKSGPLFGSSDKVNKKMLEKSPPTSQHSLAIKNSEWELGEVTKPAAVPFLWEKIPGRPKGEGDGQIETPKRSSSAPRLPPGRVTDVRRYSGERPIDQNTYNKSQWRNSGERSVDQTTYKSQWRKSGERPIDQNFYRPQSEEVYPPTDHAALLESLRESIYANGESDVESMYDAYSDTPDTLSPAESLSLNCSISGLSGSEFPDVKPSGTFHVDQQTRDFMISRFLPAAKAMVIETPQYVPRKQSVSAEQMKLSLVVELKKQVKKVTTDEKKPLLDQHKSNLVLSNTRYVEDVKSEADDDKDDNHGNDRVNEHGKRLGKAWGFFPRLCVKKSLCLLNPLPALKSSKSQVPKSPGIDVSRLTRKAYSGPLDKPTWDSSHQKRFHSGVLPRELNRIETRASETNQLSYSSASYKAGGLSPCGPFRSGGISPYRNSRPQSPFSKGTSFLGMPKEVESLSRSQSPFKGTSFLGMPKEVESHSRSQSPVRKGTSFLDMPKEDKSLTRRQSPFDKGSSFFGTPKVVANLTSQKCSSNNKGCNCLDAPPACAHKEETVSLSNVAEKTLYIDSVNSVKPVKNLAPSEIAKLGNSSYKNLETLPRNRRKEYLPANANSSFLEAASLDKINRRTKAELKSSVLEDTLSSSSACSSKFRGIADGYEDSKIYQSVNQEMKLDSINHQPEAQADPSVDTLQSPHPPPLPKSPSESWLWRTVPSVHLHNPFSLLQRGNHYHSKKTGQKASTNGTKWETIVKTSNVHHDLGRYSEELSPHIADKQDRR
ncbi:hypothetical protein M9H77_26155 [Catharanthus roseus]|uniref:Uncharacterized protein n=1 Tax=Catharanthus roseus TaxID=4058 RepID=A0ACC0ABL3_CATRO|nr:hypothetical protein M9H77_26155 [Catharanthus roseus]